ncbi:MAG: hypothetical protein V1684_03125 [bacterium]
MICKTLNYKTSASVIPAKAGIQPKKNSLPKSVDSRFRGNDNGFILLVVFLVVFMLLLMAIYFFSFIITELKISKNQSIAEQTYYLAESGIEEAIWKLKNDADWQTNFENDPDWTASFSRENIFFTGGGYTVQIQNYDYAKAEIISTGSYAFFSGASAQRIIKIKAFKALNPNPVEQIAIFTGDGNLDIHGRDADLTDGGLFANGDINITYYSDTHTTETASTTDDIYVDYYSSLDADGSEGYESQQENWPPITMPMIDFDSDDPTSYYNQADNIYDQNEFKQMMDDNPDLTINGITYVTGQINIKRGQHLTVNGILAADGTITLGIGGPLFGGSYLIVNNTPGQPSGVLTKNSFKTKNWANNLNVEGLLYANDSIEFGTFLWFSPPINITGGIITRQIYVDSSVYGNLDMIYDSAIIQTALGQPLYSQVVSVEHWEEQY